MPKVSILLPVYNSITRMEKPDFLQQMVDSILNQTFKDFELLIIDNQSTDGTTEICKDIAMHDSRVIVHVDTKRRPTEEAMNKYHKITKGKYIMMVCDDDLLNYHYIKTLVDELEINKKADVAYTNGYYINIDNKVIGGLITNTDGIYNSKHYYENFYKYIHTRIVLPIINSIYRKDVFQSLMPLILFDELGANMDNLFMAKFFLNKYNASFINQNLFYYRHRDRSLNPEKSDYMPTNPILIWVYYVRHQLYFYHAVCFLIETTDQGEHTETLRITTLDSCINQCGNLLNWVGRDLVRDMSEFAIMKKIGEQFKPIYDLQLTCLADTPEMLKEQQDTMRLRCKMLNEHVMKYILTIVQDTTIVEDTQKVLGGIKKDIITQLRLET